MLGLELRTSEELSVLLAFEQSPLGLLRILEEVFLHLVFSQAYTP